MFAPSGLLYTCRWLRKKAVACIGSGNCPLNLQGYLHTAIRSSQPAAPLAAQCDSLSCCPFGSTARYMYLTPLYCSGDYQGRRLALPPHDPPGILEPPSSGHSEQASMAMLNEMFPPLTHHCISIHMPPRNTPPRMGGDVQFGHFMLNETQLKILRILLLTRLRARGPCGPRHDHSRGPGIPPITLRS